MAKTKERDPAEEIAKLMHGRVQDMKDALIVAAHSHFLQKVPGGEKENEREDTIAANMAIVSGAFAEALIDILANTLYECYQDDPPHSMEIFNRLMDHIQEMNLPMLMYIIQRSFGQKCPACVKAAKKEGLEHDETFLQREAESRVAQAEKVLRKLGGKVRVVEEETRTDREKMN